MRNSFVQSSACGLAAFVFACLAINASAHEVGSPPTMSESAVDCHLCHMSDAPSKEEPALKDCARHPVHEKADPSGNESPDYFIIDELTSIYVPVVFPHRLHASMSEMGVGCMQCHHYTEEGAAIQRCSTCHAMSPDPAQENLEQPSLKGAYHRQCIGCHREWSHETKCGICHAKRVPGEEPALPKDPSDVMGLLHPNVQAPAMRVYETDGMGLIGFRHDDHVKRYGFSCADCHREWDCSRCHEPGAVQARAEETDPHNQCIMCHQGEVEERCEFCHGDDVRPPFSHERETGVALAAFHEEVTCRGCHDASELRFQPVEKKECTQCHGPDWAPDSFDHTLVGIQMEESHAEMECMTCHIAGMGEPTDCSTCHEGNDMAFPKVEAAPEKPVQETAVATDAAENADTAKAGEVDAASETDEGKG